MNKTKAAGEFNKNSGHSTEEEAITMIRDGNISNLPHTVGDIKRYYDIYGQGPNFYKERTRKRKVNRVEYVDAMIK